MQATSQRIWDGNVRERKKGLMSSSHDIPMHGCMLVLVCVLACDRTCVEGRICAGLGMA